MVTGSTIFLEKKALYYKRMISSSIRRSVGQRVGVMTCTPPFDIFCSLVCKRGFLENVRLFLSFLDSVLNEGCSLITLCFCQGQQSRHISHLFEILKYPHSFHLAYNFLIWMKIEKAKEWYSVFWSALKKACKTMGKYYPLKACSIKNNLRS